METLSVVPPDCVPFLTEGMNWNKKKIKVAFPKDKKELTSNGLIRGTGYIVG
jgi:hypothetical protein